MNTANILQDMLRENTGVALCDSGGEPNYDANGNYIGSSYGYGRNYEINRHVDFEKISPVTLSFSNGNIEFTHNHSCMIIMINNLVNNASILSPHGVTGGG